MKHFGRRTLWVAMAVAMAGAAAAEGTALTDSPPPPDDAAALTAITPTASQATGRGSVTNLPLPRYVTLKTGEGNARRGPSLTHRIDWVFTRAGMPLKITAEHEHWRRIEDSEGVGGWIHYALLSGSRSVQITEDMAEVRARPEAEAPVVMQAEVGVIAKLMECSADWCRVGVDGTRGWLRKSALWGADPGEIVE